MKDILNVIKMNERRDYADKNRMVFREELLLHYIAEQVNSKKGYREAHAIAIEYQNALRAAIDKDLQMIQAQYLDGNSVIAEFARSGGGTDDYTLFPDSNMENYIRK